MVSKQASRPVGVAGLERRQDLLVVAHQFIHRPRTDRAKKRARSARGSNTSWVAFNTPLRAKPTMAL